MEWRWVEGGPCVGDQTVLVRSEAVFRHLKSLETLETQLGSRSFVPSWTIQDRQTYMTQVVHDKHVPCLYG